MKTVQTIEYYDSVRDSFQWYTYNYHVRYSSYFIIVDFKNVIESANLTSIIREYLTISWFMVMYEEESQLGGCLHPFPFISLAVRPVNAI